MAEREEGSPQPPCCPAAGCGCGGAALPFAALPERSGVRVVVAQDLLQGEVQVLVVAGVHGQRPSHGLLHVQHLVPPRVDALVADAHCRRRYATDVARFAPGRRGDVDDCVVGLEDVDDVDLVKYNVGLGLAGGAGDGGPAERAVGGGVEPGVDAVDVEEVEAGRQQPESLPLLELAEAHRALARQLGLQCLLGLPVTERGYPAYRRLLQAAARRWCGRVDDMMVMLRGDVVVVAAPGGEAALGEEEVVGEEEEGGGDDADDGDGEDDEAVAREGSCAWRAHGGWLSEIDHSLGSECCAVVAVLFVEALKARMTEHPHI